MPWLRGSGEVTSDSQWKSQIETAVLNPSVGSQEVADRISLLMETGWNRFCINPFLLELLGQRLQKEGAILITVINFPNGAGTLPSLEVEALQAVNHGASALDVVLPLALIANRDFSALGQWTSHFYKVVGDMAEIRWILEMPLWPKDLFQALLRHLVKVGKTGYKTGTGTRGNTSPSQVALLHKLLPKKTPIKAAGGIADRTMAKTLLQEGATHLETSSPESLR